MAAVPVNLPASTGTVRSADRVQKLYGWTVRESDGTPAVATVVLTDADSNIVGEIELAANASSTAWFGPQGVIVRGDLTATITGTVTGAVLLG